MKTIALALLFANVAVGSSFAFNPQPDPPAKLAVSSSLIQNPGVIRGFNPQPDPPGYQMSISPQSLPPKQAK